MRIFRPTLILAAVSALLIGGAQRTAHTAGFLAGRTSAASGINSELARARAATSKYHDVATAEAEGYVSINFCEPGEGCHWLKPSLVDSNFDPEQPEILLYAPGPGNSGLRLVAVEYIVPLTLSLGAPPEGFTGNSDLWREDTEGAGLWELTAWIWMSNPNGIFEQHNPKAP